MKIKRLFIFILTAIICFGAASPVYAIDDATLDFYAENDIKFYDPLGSQEFGPAGCSPGGGDLSAPAPTTLTGGTNQEKVWNYFIFRGLTPVAAAGAMGNIEQENGAFDPYAGENGDTTWNQSVERVGFGLIQWTNTGGAGAGGRRGKLIQYLKDNGVTSPSRDNIDRALLLQLNWLWDGEYGRMTWQEQLNAESTYEGNTAIASYNSNYSANRAPSQVGNGTAMLFHSLVERSNDTPNMLQERIDSAKKFFEQFGNTSTNCAAGALAQGGITDPMQARALLVEFIDYVRQRTGSSVPNVPANITIGQALGTPGQNFDKQCEGVSCGQCTALSMWFTRYKTEYTTYGGGNGIDVVSRLMDIQANKTAGLQHGSEPQPYSIFSWSGSGSAGHTGVVLGVFDDGAILIMENNIASHQLRVQKYSREQWQAKLLRGEYSFAYVGDKLKP